MIEVCPSRVTLEALEAGRLPLTDVETWAAHLEHCPRCFAALSQIHAARVSSISRVGDKIADAFREQRSSAGSSPQHETSSTSQQMTRGGSGPLGKYNLPLPFELGQYRLVAKIGEGGMGAVYKAQHARLQRFVAIKILPPDRLIDPSALARFNREMSTIARLDHPNIVRAHDAGEHQGMHYLVMEHVDGSDLASLIRERGPLDWRRAVEFILQAARGLDYAHSEGVIHRDVKPANLLVDNKGHVKVLDLGLARLVQLPDLTSNDLTATGNIMGTVDYMSPEQALDSKRANARTDIYSLGCTLHYLLSGDAPYPGDTIVKRLLAHREAPVPSLVNRCPNAPAQLDSIFQQLVAKRPEDRYQTMAQVIAALHKPTTATNAKLDLFVNAKPQSVGDGQRRIISAPGHRRRRVLIGTAIATAIAIGIVVTAVALFRSSVSATKHPAPDLPPSSLKQPTTIASVTTIPPVKATTRNPFGKPDVENAEDLPVKHFAAQDHALAMDADPNAELWTNVKVRDQASLDGIWGTRWKNTGGAEWAEGAAEIKSHEGRVYILTSDGWIFDVRQEGNRWIGRCVAIDNESESYPFVGQIVNHGRIDGAFEGGRWDLRRGLNPDEPNEKVRNPFGKPDVENPLGADVQEFADRDRLPVGENDANARRWDVKNLTDKKNVLEGVWESRWNNDSAPDDWSRGTARIKISDERIFILYSDGGEYLIEAQLRPNNLLVGRYVNLANADETSPWVGKIVDGKNIIGEWDGGRWEFWRDLAEEK